MSWYYCWLYTTLDQQIQLDFYGASSLKQQYTGRHYSDCESIRLCSYRTPECCKLSREAANTNFIVIDLTRAGLESIIYHTWDEHANHYTTDAVHL